MFIKFGNGRLSPHTGNRILTPQEITATRERIDQTHFELNVALEKAAINVQRAIAKVQQIDRSRHPNPHERKLAMQLLRVYVGQHRVTQAMADNMNMIKAELTIREMTNDFSKSMITAGDLIRKYSAQAIGPGKLVRKMRGVIRPTQTLEALREYDRLYDELSSMYVSENDDQASGISDAWLESIVSGQSDWIHTPVTVAPPQSISHPSVPSVEETLASLKGPLSDD